MGTAEGSPERAVGPRSVGRGGRRRRRPPLAAAVTTCVILLGHQPLPAIGSSPSSLHLRPPPTVEQYRASRRTRRRDERRGESMRHRRRRNNTGFYFGLRDDDIVSCSSGAGLPSRRMEPMLSDSVATRHCLACQWTAMGDVAIQNGHREETVHELCSDGTVEQTAPGPLPVGECNQRNGISAVDSSKRFLRQFANRLRPLDRRKWNELWEQRGRMPQLERLSTSVGKAVSLLGGSSTIISWEDGQNQRFRHLSESGGAVVQASTTTKQRKKPRTRRKNNTGFYYGIREDVLFSPSPATTGKRSGKAAPLQQSDGSATSEPKGSNEVKPPAEGKGLPLPPAPKDEPPARKQREKASRPKKQNTKPRKKSNGDVAPGISDVFGETLLELREMREEIVALREELKAMKGKMKRDKPGGVAVEAPPPSAEEEPPLEDSAPKVSKRERQRGFDRIGKDVEQWAVDLLFGQEDRAGDGWKEISCNNFVRKKFNKHGRTEVYVKWMPDTRDDGDIESTSSRTQEYPCLKCYSTIDAPIEDVCSFLANEETMPLYNELVTDHAEVEEITPHGKITWTKCPKILFVKPRDFVTYCSHRWRRDGTQVLINQACEHEDRPAVLEEGQADACRGFALRGANFISRDPDDPTKTRFTMLSHANPGGGLPQWAMNTAVNAVVQIEPFKFFHNINDSICNYQESPTPRTSVVKNIPGRSSKPAGIAHLGFTCFWPNGGGLKEIDQQDGLEREEEMIGFDD